MKHDLIAILPGHVDDPMPRGLVALPGKGFTAVLSRKPAAGVFGRSLRRQRLKSAPQRQRWLEALMENDPVLPVIPGAALRRRDVPGLLAANAEVLRRLVERLEGKLQYQIAVHWREDQFLNRFRDAPEIAPLFTQASVSPQAVTGAVARLSARLCGEIAARLMAVSDEYSELPVDGDMLSNQVVLADAARMMDLDAALDAIDAIWSDGFRIRQIGPSPATSFASLTMQRCSVTELDRARTVLGVAAGASSEDVHQARQSALRADHTQTARIRHAARLLQARLVSGTEGPVFLLDTWGESQSGQPMLEHVA